MIANANGYLDVLFILVLVLDIHYKRLRLEHYSFVVYMPFVSVFVIVHLLTSF